MSKMQLNVVLPEADAKRIKKDAIEMNVTLNDYARRAFQAFLAKPVACRRVVFDDTHPKTLGRKIGC